MNIIKSHDITLIGKLKEYNIQLKPLNDKHLPLLFKWNADPDVTYWCEGSDLPEGNDEKTVCDIYSYVSKIAFCFLLEVNGEPIGDCWLEEMNIQEVSDMYPNLNVKRIDMMIGEKDWWGKGIGTALVGILTDYAFEHDNVDIIHIPSVFDFNIRSQKAFLKNGYRFIKATNVADNKKMKQEYHYALYKADYTPCYNLTYEKADR